MTKLQLRVATVGDAESIVRIVNSAYRPMDGVKGWTHESDLVRGERTSSGQIEALIASSTLIVGTIENEVVACVHVQGKGNEGHIGMLAVQPSLQAGGIGKALLAQAEYYAESVLNTECFVLIVVSEREELIEFYIRRGYTRTGVVLDYPTEAGVGIPLCGVLRLEVLRKNSRSG